MLNLKEVGVMSEKMVKFPLIGCVNVSLKLRTFEISLKIYRSFTNHRRLTHRMYTQEHTTIKLFMTYISVLAGKLLSISLSLIYTICILKIYI